MKIIDFSSCPLSPKNLEYGGRAGEKRGILLEGANWILKFPKSTGGMDNVKGLSYVTSPLSEYLGSHIYEILGYEVQETRLGICFDGHKYKVVCACKDFLDDREGEILLPYTSLRNDTNPIIMEKRDSSSFSASNIHEIAFQLENNTILGSLSDAKRRFWDCVIIDTLINNNDRNEDNWGVIKNKNKGTYRLAPVFDCGNSFYGKASEERIQTIVADPSKLLSSAINGITAYEDDQEKRIRNLDILHLDNLDLKAAVKRVYALVKEKWDEIEYLIDDIPETENGLLVMSETRKRYYKETIRLRFENILEKVVLG